jgi:hypothetical protein
LAHIIPRSMLHDMYQAERSIFSTSMKPISVMTL